MNAPQLLGMLLVPGIFLVTVILLIGAYEAGFRLGDWQTRRRGSAKMAHIGTTVSGMLALLAFMLGFAFAMASDRFNDRKELVLEEANAIGTTWLRARALPPPFPERMIPLLREYVDVRLYQESSPREYLITAQQAISRSSELHEQLWSQTMDLVEEHPNSRVMVLFMNSLNQMIDLHESRISFGLYFQIAPSVWRTLYLVAVLTFIAIGYEAGRSGARHPLPVALSLMFALSLVLALIVDLDKPAQQLFQVTDQPLTDLRTTMDAVR